MSAMSLMRRSRSDAPVGKDLHSHLGKSLAHHQIVPSTLSTGLGDTSNRPAVNSRNELLSSTGGLGRMNQHTHNTTWNPHGHRRPSHQYIHQSTPFDRRFSFANGKPFRGVPSHGSKGK